MEGQCAVAAEAEAEATACASAGATKTRSSLVMGTDAGTDAGADVRSVLVLDGGQATELESRAGADLSATCLWSAALLLERGHGSTSTDGSERAAVVRMHRQFYLAGADVATTISYQASWQGFQRELGEAMVPNETAMEPFYAKSIAWAVEARDQAWRQLQQRHEQAVETTARQKPMVAASIGCYGAALADGAEYRGDYALTRHELVAWHRHRFAFFAMATEVSFLLCETIPCLAEVEAIVDLVNEYPSARVMIAMACRDGSALNSGEPIAGVTRILGNLRDPTQVLAVGVNCTAPQFVESLLRAFDCPCVKMAYPNSGEGWNAVTHEWVQPETGTTSEEHSWATYLPKWIEAGARVFGGCCRTSTADIQAIRAFLAQEAIVD